MRSLLLGAAVLVTACGTYNANRSALVPRATPRMTTGQPIPGKGALTLGASSVTHLSDPSVGEDPNAGVEIPGTQLFGSLRGQVGDMVSFGLLYENGLDSGAKPIKAKQPPVDNGNVEGYGFTMDISIPVDPKFRIGIGLDAMTWRVPWAQYAVCDDPNNCFFDRVESTGSDGVETLAASITPSYKPSKEVTVFGSLTVRNHPTIQQRVTIVDPIFDDPEVQSGPGNYIVAAGAEVAFAEGHVLASAMLYYDLTKNPVDYGPGLSFMLSIPFGERRDAPPPPVMYAPPGYAPAPMYPPPSPTYPPPTYPAPPPAPAPAPPPPAPYPPPAPAPAPAPQ